MIEILHITFTCCYMFKTNIVSIMFGRETWSSGHGRRLTFKRSCVRIPAPDTLWAFFTYIVVPKNCNVCFKRPIKEDGHFRQKI